jgi:hypothetical protein
LIGNIPLDERNDAANNINELQLKLEQLEDADLSAGLEGLKRALFK